MKKILLIVFCISSLAAAAQSGKRKIVLGQHSLEYYLPLFSVDSLYMPNTDSGAVRGGYLTIDWATKKVRLAAAPGGGGSGVTTMTAPSGTSNANGATISTTNLTLTYGDATNPGIMKKYTATGSNTDGTMDQNSITTALSGKAASSHTHAISTDITGLGTGVATALATPSSANLITAVTDETGTGSLMFGTSPTTSSMTIGAGSTTVFPLKFTSGALLTTAAVGVEEFLTDKRYTTITTGTARKEYALFDAAGTSGRVPYETTNGRLLDNANFLFATTKGGTFSVGTTGTTGNLNVGATATATGNLPLAVFTGAAHTNQTLSTELTDINFALNRTVQFATGALATQRVFRIQAPTYGFVGASTITKATTLSVSGAPIAGTNATITTGIAIEAESGDIVATSGNITASGKVSANKFISTGSAPGISNGGTTVIGSTGNATITGRDAAMQITLGTSGTAPSAVGNIATITFNTAYTTAPIIVLTNVVGSDVTFAWQVTSVSTTGFSIRTPSILPNAQTYIINAIVIQ